MTMIWLSNVVPYLAYSAPLMEMFALTLYLSLMSFHHFRKAGFDAPMPSPTMATSLPPGASRFSACSRCLAPFMVSLRFVRPAVEEKGGFITTTVA